MDRKTQVNSKRRGFLLAAGAGSAAAVGVVATLQPSANVPNVADAKPVATQGYRDSDHIRHYYDSARV
jgi:hypothetical protein